MREKLLFDFGWRFHLGEIGVPAPLTKMQTYLRAKTERALLGPASPDYRDEEDRCPDRWETVDLPHDYIIVETPRETSNPALGCFDYPAAWYRNRFRLEDSDRGRHITIYFEGIAVHAEVYVNGCLMARSFGGYTPFEADITDIARFGGENVVAIRVDASDHEGWWYEGAGIYRHVWLIKTEKVCVDRWGVWVHPEKTGDRDWSIPVETTLRNFSDTPALVTLRTSLIDRQGREIATAESEAAALPARDKAVLRQTLAARDPLLWEIDEPALYTLRTALVSGGEEIDTVDTRFGFRTIAFDADRGFFLNGRPVKLKGVCCHQDYGLTGKAVPDRVHRYRLKLLREMGANAYRASHYPPAETAMDALDELGFLVMDETRRFESTPEGISQLKTMLLRDRNHPCVILWSLGNEEPLHATEAGARILRSMTAAVKKLDGTRPVTTAVCHDPLQSPAVGASEVIGVNYNLGLYDAIHAKYPTLPFVASECCAVGTTRGWYLGDDPSRGYLPAWDHPTGDFTCTREETWKHIMARNWVAGGFQWAGIEHRGETVWPRLCSQSGALDLFLQRKDAFYQNMSHWTEKPMVHLLPHWNQPGREGERLPVWVYSNCEEIELFQDGVSLGAQRPGRFGHGVWQVEYRPGCLIATGRVGGKEAARESVETTGPAAVLKLRLEDGGLKADHEDFAILTCYCEDAQGRFVPDAAPLIRFSCDGPGAIAATGSDISDHTPVSSPDRRMRAGLCAVLLRLGDKPGALRVWACAEGLRPAALTLDVAPAERRPWVRPAG